MRTPKSRGPVITAEMIDLFSRGRRLQKQIDKLEDRLRDVRRDLHRLCALAPWEADVLTVPDVLHWPRAGNLHDESAAKVLAIRQAIEAALEEAAPRKRAAGESADLE
jgi:hypothetical protein